MHTQIRQRRYSAFSDSAMGHGGDAAREGDGIATYTAGRSEVGDLVLVVLWLFNLDVDVSERCGA